MVIWKQNGPRLLIAYLSDFSFGGGEWDTPNGTQGLYLAGSGHHIEL